MEAEGRVTASKTGQGATSQGSQVASGSRERQATPSSLATSGRERGPANIRIAVCETHCRLPASKKIEDDVSVLWKALGNGDSGTRK